MYIRQSSEPMPCGYCGERAMTLYAFNNAAPPDICPRCLRQMVSLMDTLREEPDDSRHEAGAVRTRMRALVDRAGRPRR